MASLSSISPINTSEVKVLEEIQCSKTVTNVSKKVLTILQSPDSLMPPVQKLASGLDLAPEPASEINPLTKVSKERGQQNHKAKLLAVLSKYGYSDFDPTLKYINSDAPELKDIPQQFAIVSKEGLIIDLRTVADTIIKSIKDNVGIGISKRYVEDKTYISRPEELDAFEIWEKEVLGTYKIETMKKEMLECKKYYMEEVGFPEELIDALSMLGIFMQDPFRDFSHPSFPPIDAAGSKDKSTDVKSCRFVQFNIFLENLFKKYNQVLRIPFEHFIAQDHLWEKTAVTGWRQIDRPDVLNIESPCWHTLERSPDGTVTKIRNDGLICKITPEGKIFQKTTSRNTNKRVLGEQLHPSMPYNCFSQYGYPFQNQFLKVWRNVQSKDICMTDEFGPMIRDCFRPGLFLVKLNEEG